MEAATQHYEESLPAPTAEQTQSALVKQQALIYMAQLHGWCSNEKGEFLIDLILKTKPHTLVEIGVWGGKSLIPMAEALKQNRQGIIFGIDPWDEQASIEWAPEGPNRNFWQSANHEWVFRHLNERIDEFGLRGQIVLIKNTSEAAPAISEIDLLHIDGNHSENASYFDVLKWVPLVKSGGWIIFDDITWAENGVQTTAKASRWLDANCHKLAEFTDNCTWGVWIKP